jgi:hypothetical protein
MENTIGFDIALLLAMLAMLDKNNVKGSEEYGNESEGSKDVVVLDKED